MTTLDIILLIFIGYGFIRGLFKGLFVEVASLLALVLGIYGAVHFSDFMSSYLQESLNWNKKYTALVAFTLTFIAIVIVIKLLGKFLTQLADFASLGLLNKLFGGVFGFFKMALIASVLLMLFHKLNTKADMVDETTLQKSVLYSPVKEIAVILFPSFFDEPITKEIKSIV